VGLFNLLLLKFKIGLKDTPTALIGNPIDVMLLHHLKDAIPFFPKPCDLVIKNGYCLPLASNSNRLANGFGNRAPSWLVKRASAWRVYLDLYAPVMGVDNPKGGAMPG